MFQGLSLIHRSVKFFGFHLSKINNYLRAPTIKMNSYIRHSREITKKALKDTSFVWEREPNIFCSSISEILCNILYFWSYSDFPRCIHTFTRSTQQSQSHFVQTVFKGSIMSEMALWDSQEFLHQDIWLMREGTKPKLSRQSPLAISPCLSTRSQTV